MKNSARLKFGRKFKTFGWFNTLTVLGSQSPETRLSLLSSDPAVVLMMSLASGIDQLSP